MRFLCVAAGPKSLFALSQSNRITCARSIQIEWATSLFKMNGAFERNQV
jgi:hypothetical protein